MIWLYRFRDARDEWIVVTKILRDQYPKLPVIMVIEYEEHARTNCLDMFNDFLLKPVLPEPLESMIKKGT